MKIDVKKVAKLSNLTLSPDEEKEYETQLEDVLGYIEKLNAVDTSNIEPTAQVTGLKNRTRTDDKIQVCLTQEEATISAKSKSNNLFKVPKLVDTTE